MKEEFITYQQAKALKECGFDWGSHAYYAVEPNGHPDLWISGAGHVSILDLSGRDVLAPTQAIAMRWLRNEKGIEVVVEPVFRDNSRRGYDWFVFDDCSGGCVLRAPLPLSETYEAALSAGIDAALELIKQK